MVNEAFDSLACRVVGKSEGGVDQGWRRDESELALLKSTRCVPISALETRI